MKKSTKIIAVVLTLVLATGIFAACGKKANDEKQPEAPAKKTVKVIDVNLTEEQYAFGVDKNQPELLEKVNAAIKEMKENGEMEAIFNNYFGDGTPVPVASAELDTSKDQFVVATNAEFKPFEYTEGDKFVGIDMEIAAALAKKFGQELVIQHMDFDAVCLSVQQHKCDIAMAALTINEERKASVEFTDSYYQASQKLIVPSTETKFDACKTADEVLAVLQGMDASTKVGFQTGTTGQGYTSNEGDYATNALKVTPVGYNSAALAVQDVLNGNLTYVVTDAAPADAIVKAING